jgi:hypothetical protein
MVATSISAAFIVPSQLCRSIFLRDSRETEDRENGCRRHATATRKVGCAHATLVVCGERMRCGNRGPRTAAQPDAENRRACGRMPAKVGRYGTEGIEHALALLRATRRGAPFLNAKAPMASTPLPSSLQTNWNAHAAWFVSAAVYTRPTLWPAWQPHGQGRAAQNQLRATESQLAHGAGQSCPLLQR